jgi:tetratricopeptide (TPR) repeat protein
MRFAGRKSRMLTAWASVVMLAGGAMAQENPHASPNPARAGRASERRAQPAAIYDKTFFEHSLLDTSRAQARQALVRNPRNLDALFVEMEAAALEADTPAVIDAAVRMLAVPSAQRDQRTAIAAARLYDLAANTREFAKVLPRLEAIAARDGAESSIVRGALVKAGMDGLRGVNVETMAKAAGILTEWRAAGPFGEYANLDFNRAFAPQTDMLMGSASDGRPVELFRFADGMFRLPDYFGSDGVFYAMSQTQSGAGAYDVRVESAGTLEVLVDGKSVLRHDSRFRVMPDTISAPVRLARGTHQLLVKFLGGAAPFRISLVRHIAALPAPAVAYAPERQYIAASAKFWNGDYAGAVQEFEELRQAHESAATNWMLYHAWSSAERDAPEAGALLDSVLRLTPEALAADYETAARDYTRGRMDEALAHLSKVLGRREYFAPAEELMGDLAMRLHLPVRAARAIEILVDIHPSCDVLRRAQHFFSLQARYDRARQIDADLSECEPNSLVYATTLSESGEHQQAASAAEQVVARNPLDRPAREMLARELALAGNGDAARQAIEELAALAPNSARYRRMAAAAQTDPLTLLDDSSASGTADAKPFYQPYRRDGIDVVKEAANRHFSGGPALMLLDDEISRLWPDGSVSLYVHRITRALDRGGVERYGEVSVPADAQVLELRTIRADGNVLEPELTPDKATISMPGLLPGDAVDEEYLFHYGAGDANLADAFAHTFGSFRAPVLASRYILLTPANAEEVVQASATAPSMAESRTGSLHARVWEMKDIAQSVEEPASATGDILPTIRISPALERGWEDVRDGAREIAVDAEQAGPRVNEAARGLIGPDDEATARALYRFVTSNVRATSWEFGAEMPSAEATLMQDAGSRTAALLGLANAAGVHADLVLARDAGHVNVTHEPAEEVYTRPLVRFALRDSGGTREAIVDAEDDLPFGILPPTIVRHDALLVTLPTETQDAKVEPALMRLPERPENDESVARADVKIASSGDLSADITILVGTWRGVEMRESLADAGAEREEFFEHLARRIFPDAENVTGEVRNELNPGRTLEITLHCTSPQQVDLTGGVADMDQLVPDLGLKSMYPSVTDRKFPLFVSAPLFETATFRIHLPEGVVVARPASDLHVHSEFGTYSVTFREPEPRVLEVTRTFDVPVQVVATGKLVNFAKFAGEIDSAEHQKIGLQVERMVARSEQGGNEK